MNIEEGLLLQRKLKYVGVKRKDAYKAMNVSPMIAEMMMKGQVLCGKVDEDLKRFIIKTMIKKFGKKKKK